MQTVIKATLTLSLGAVILLPCPLMVQAQRIPHGQDRMPNAPRSPQEAVKRMTVPDGFQVELVASEPDIVNPVAMTFDERGRIWITESIEYPRRSAGPGRDRIKILEDTDRDGRADKFTVFADGLNIPSGIAIGYGGVWVANAPDLLFLRDTDGDDKADESQVVVTGFGRDDTHELPNSLTWGPDGWLYGLNGVFNPSRIRHRNRDHRFTCAMFRVNPRPDTDGPWKGTHEFGLFCEGTSNPWGIAFDNEGSAFISACVIDHLWHLTETGYYHRQGGPYPPFTWKINSIVNHAHQKAAYCGLEFFDSDAYPPQYRERLYMGNIHGGCINVDQLSRNGSTYLAKGQPDFLTANDSWFMPVVQKTGPDGCLYILDWYDRYHCYQDANRDPQGIDRLKGRLYRVRYQNTPRAPSFDLRYESDGKLIERLHNSNVYFRRTAQRLLAERRDESLKTKLEQLVLDDKAPRKARMHALWAMIGQGPLSAAFHMDLLAHHDASIRAWAVRAAGNMGFVNDDIRQSISSLVNDPSPDVALQIAIASQKINGLDPLPTLVAILGRADEDVLIPRIVWQNLHPLLEKRADDYVAMIESQGLENRGAVVSLMPRVMDRMLAANPPDPAALVHLFGLLSQSGQQVAAGKCLQGLAASMQSRLITSAQLAQLRPRLEPELSTILASTKQHPLYLDAATVAATWGDPSASEIAAEVVSSDHYPDARRVQALEALIGSGNEAIFDAFNSVLSQASTGSQNFRRLVISAMGRVDDQRVAHLVLSHYHELQSPLRPVAIQLLTQRAGWSKPLLDSIERGAVSRDDVNLTQVKQLVAFNDDEISRRVVGIWGSVRTDRDPERERVVDRVRQLVWKNLHQADFANGESLFEKKCAICHTFHGKGQTVGPDITSNGRASFEQLLSNILDPNLVIGGDYQARIILTIDGRVLTGLLVEDSPRLVVLKMQGGEIETIARRDIDELVVSKVSLMPENPETDMSDQDLVDLIAFVASDAREGQAGRDWIPGIRAMAPMNIRDPDRYHEILDQFAPGFTTQRVGEGGLGIVDEHFGRARVLRTHPVSRREPCILQANLTIPENKRTYLSLSVSHEPGAGERDWQLVVKADNEIIHQSIVGPATTVDHWSDVTVDLTKFAGQTINLELHNQANNWAWEFAYWDRIEVVSE